MAHSAWTLLAVFTFTGHTMAVPRVTIQGQIEYTNTNTRLVVDPPEERKVRFTAQVEGCNWRIRLHSSNGNLVDSFDVANDGKYTYYVESFESAVNRSRAVGEKVGPNVASALISPLPIPAFTFAHRFGPLWLTYASGYYLSTVHTNRAYSPAMKGTGSWYGDDRIPDRPIVQRFTLVDGRNALGTPKLLVYFNDDPPAGLALRDTYTSVLKYTNTVLQILSDTNTPEGIYPAHARMQTSYVRRNLSGQPEVYACIYEVRTETLSFAEGLPPGDLMPDIPGNTLFTDERVSLAKGFDFSYMTNHWLSDKEAAKRPEYTQASYYHSRVLPETTVHRRSLAVLVVLGLFTVVPLVLVCLKSASKR